MTDRRQGKQYELRTYEQHGAQHAKEVVVREGLRTGKVPSGGRRGSVTVMGGCPVSFRKRKEEWRGELIWESSESLVGRGL